MSSESLLDLRNAPVTKFLVPVVGGCSLLTTFLNKNPQLLQRLSQFNLPSQAVKVFVSHWAFKGTSTAIIGSWLIYKMRIVERRYGSAKYIAFIFVSFVTSTLLQSGALSLGSKRGLESIASGPFAVLFAVMYQYHMIVPPAFTTTIFGVNISDKAYVTISALQLLLSNSVPSVVPCLCGLIASRVYEASDFLKSWRFPEWSRLFASNYLLPILSTSKKIKSTPLPTSTSIPTPRRSPPPPPPISEEDINTMFIMFPNYSRQDIKRALIESKSDLNRAADILLSSEPNAGSSRT